VQEEVKRESRVADATAQIMAPAAAMSASVPDTPAATPVAVAQPRLSPDAIVVHPERVESPVIAATEFTPALPANHEVVPGSVLARTSHAAAAPSVADTQDETALLSAVEHEPVADRGSDDAHEAVLAASAVGDELVSASASAEESALAGGAATASVVDTAVGSTGAVVSTGGATVTASGDNGLFGRLAGLFGRQSTPATSAADSATTGFNAQHLASPSRDSTERGAAPGAAQLAESPVVAAAEPAPVVSAQSSREPSTAPGVGGDTAASVGTTRRIPGDMAGANADIDDAKRALAVGELARAAEIFNRLAQAGDAEAQAHIGYMYYTGEGVDLDLVRAVDWYRRAAVQGNRDAQYNLAVAYAFGEGVRQNDDEAAIWYRRAAEQGSAIAQYSLGMSYALGEGVPQSDVEATKWYRVAAEQGYAAAQYNLGYSYRTGHGVAADETEAHRWFEAAAANGHASAQYSLGYMYRSGRGVERDVEEAIKWYRLAAEQGHPDARADLASLNPDD
tara:strand:- start:5247 stop:6773 length:1527 start_codon:yes stop_codon:yes gene_type:complete